MKKMRFWQKTYILTLSIFLGCLYLCLFSLMLITYQRSLKENETIAKARFSYIIDSFERDKEDVEAFGDDSSLKLLMYSYTSNIATDEKLHIAFFENGSAVAQSSSIPQKAGFKYHSYSKMEKIEKTRYYVTHWSFGDDCDMVLMQDFSELYREFRVLCAIYVTVAAVVSGGLAVALLFVLKKLSVPLETLKTTTERIREGNFDEKANENGGDEIASLGKSFNSMVERIKAQMLELENEAVQKQQLVDDMAHEMRTPLTNIYGYAEYIEKAPLSESETLESAEFIMSEAKRLKNISEKILDTSYIRNNEIKKTELKVEQLFSETKRILMNVANKPETEIILDCDDSKIMGDETLLVVLLCNLTENAIKASKKDEKVTLFCENGMISVIDHGKGMTPEQLSNITKPFYRTDKSRSRADGGAGLGLALSKQIVESHGGTMNFDSELGKGTKITIDLTTR